MFKSYASPVLMLALAVSIEGCGTISSRLPRSELASASDTYRPSDVEVTAAEMGDDVRSRPERIPTAAEIFDFHPRGAPPGRWREPFIVSYTEGPLNRYRLATLAELKALQDHRYDLTAPAAPMAPH